MIELCGGVLFPAEMQSKAIVRQLCDKKAPPQLPPGHKYGKPMEHIIKRCLAIDQSRRPTAGEVLQVCPGGTRCCIAL